MITCVYVHEQNDNASKSASHSARNKKLKINTRDAATKVEERSRVIDERVTRKIEEYTDETTGKIEFRTLEYIEKTIEHEVYIYTVLPPSMHVRHLVPVFGTMYTRALETWC